MLVETPGADGAGFSASAPAASSVARVEPAELASALVQAAEAAVPATDHVESAVTETARVEPAAPAVTSSAPAVPGAATVSAPAGAAMPNASLPEAADARRETRLRSEEVSAAGEGADGDGAADAADDPYAHLSDDDLANSISVVSDQIEELMAFRLGLVASYDRRRAYLPDGAPNMSTWLTERLTVSAAQARDIATVAKRVDQLPELRRAHEDRRLTFDQVKVLVKVAGPDNDAELAEQAPGWSVAQCEAVARRHGMTRRRQARRLHEAEFLRLFFEEGNLRLMGELADDNGVVVYNVLNDLADSYEPDETGKFAPIGERLARALVELASKDLAGQVEGHRATVICHIDADTLAGLDGEATLEGGPDVAAETVRRLLCDGRFQFVKENANGEPIAIGRTSRFATWAQRRAMLRRDLGCRFPGCGRTRWLNAHHITYWELGGDTDLYNLITTCVFHHHLVHEGGWTISGDPNKDVTFTSPLGRAFTSRAMPSAAAIRGLRSDWEDPDGDADPDPPWRYWEPEFEDRDPSDESTWTWREPARCPDDLDPDWEPPPE
jgi:hypothetical protein